MKSSTVYMDQIFLQKDILIEIIKNKLNEIKV